MHPLSPIQDEDAEQASMKLKQARRIWDKQDAIRYVDHCSGIQTWKEWWEERWGESYQAYTDGLIARKRDD